MIPAGAIDCDVHLPVPGVNQLLPYLDDFWRDMVVSRGLDRLDLTSLGKSPMSIRPDWRLPTGSEPDVDTVRTHLLDRWKLKFGICSCIQGSVALHSEDLGSAIVGAVNDWVADKWLRPEPRLRGTILVHADNPRRAAEEIERLGGDSRFVQVMLLVMQNTLFGKRPFWPIFEAAQKYDLPIAIHAGSLYRHAPSTLGWPSYYVNDYVNQSFAFQAQLMSMLMEGVFGKFPRLRVVLLESGFSWLPNFLWRANKTWKGTRIEIPWVHRLPTDIIREKVRITTQPFDGPLEPGRLEKVMKQIGGDQMMLFSSDYPHWHFDGDEPLPPELPAPLTHRCMYENAVSTYPRLGG
jgi:predicted TIM-barrel fold metal-dependent hydrolase